MSFTCPRCGAVSHNKNDEKHGYCARCHEFVENWVVNTASGIYKIGKDARDRGLLSMWTVYDKPLDYPEGFIARCFETGGGKTEPVATEYVITGSLDLIRQSMERCGLYCMPRQVGDHPSAVETWL